MNKTKLVKFTTLSVIFSLILTDASVLFAQGRKRQAGRKTARASARKSSVSSTNVASTPVVAENVEEKTVQDNSSAILSEALAKQTAATNAAQAQLMEVQRQASNATAQLSQVMEDKTALETQLSLQKLEAKQNEIALEAELANSELVNKYLKQKENIKSVCGGLSSKLSAINKDLGLGATFGTVGTIMGVGSALTNIKNQSVGAKIAYKTGIGGVDAGWMSVTRGAGISNAGHGEAGLGSKNNVKLKIASTATSAVSTATNIASAVNLGQASKALESFVGAFRKCKSEAEKLSPILAEMEEVGNVPSDTYNEALAIFNNCSKLDVAAMDEVKSKAKAAAVTAGVGAGVSTVATVAQGVQLVTAFSGSAKADNFANKGTSGKVMNGIGSIGNLASTATNVATSIISGTAKSKLQKNVGLLEQCSGLVNR